jgi:hypothetical protein
LDIEEAGQKATAARRIMPWARQSLRGKTLVEDGYR